MNENRFAKYAKPQNRFTKYAAPVEGPIEEQDGFVERVGKDFSKRFENVQEKKRQFEQGKTKAGLVGAKAVGQAAAFLGQDIVGEGLVSGFRMLPDGVEQPIRNAGKNLANSPVGQVTGKAMQKVSNVYGDVKEAFPDEVGFAEDVFNVGTLLAPVKTPVKATPTKLTSMGDSIIAKGSAQTKNERNSFVQKLVMPKATPSVKIDQVSRTKESGLFNSKAVTPTPREAEMASEVAKIKSIHKKNTIQGNYNILQGEVEKEANRLKNRLTKNDVSISVDEFKDQLNQASQRLQASPLIVGDAEKTAEKLISKMNSLLDEMPNPTASNLLEARKKLDSWIRSQKGNSVFDAGRESALTMSLREIRQTTNNFIDMKATNVPVKKSLRRQSNLYSAMENIAPKAADEAENSIKRLVQTVTKVVPLKGEIAQTLAALASVAGVGTAIAITPAAGTLTALGLGSYGAVKAAKSATTKKALGTLLKQTDRALAKTKDANLIRQLRADRAALLEVIKNHPSDNDPTPGQDPDQEGYQTQNRTREQIP